MNLTRVITALQIAKQKRLAVVIAALQAAQREAKS